MRLHDETPRTTPRLSNRFRTTGRCQERNMDVKPVLRSESEVWQQEPDRSPAARSPIVRGQHRRMGEQTWEHT